MAELRTTIPATPPPAPTGGLRPFAGFPNYQQTAPNFPFANILQQLQASMNPGAGGPYGRFAGVGGANGAPSPGGASGGGLGGLLGLPGGAPGGGLPPGGGNGGLLSLPTQAPGTMSVGQKYGVGSFNANPGSAGPVNLPVGQNQMVTVNANGGGGPVSFSPAQFHTVMGQDPALALQMLSAGGQQYSNAVMQNMGWTNDQMNQFINNTSYNTPSAGGWTPQNIALLQGLIGG